MATLYHLIPVPVTIISAIVAALQKVCATAVGRGVTLTVTATAVLVALSQAFNVCVA